MVLQCHQEVVGAGAFLNSGARSIWAPPEQPEMDSFDVGRVVEPQRGQADAIRFGRL